MRTSVILAGKCDSCRHSTTSFCESVKLKDTIYKVSWVVLFCGWEIAQAHSIKIMYPSKLIKASTSPPLLGIPRAFETFAVPQRREFDYQSLPGGGEFELPYWFHVKSLAWRTIMGDAVLEDFHGKDCAFEANWLRGKGLNKPCAVFEGIFKYLQKLNNQYLKKLNRGQLLWPAASMSVNKVSDDAGQWNGHDIVISISGIFFKSFVRCLTHKEKLSIQWPCSSDFRRLAWNFCS